MCGICGYVSKKRITEDELRTMNDTMIHRGPNDSGVELYDGTNDYVIGFAQRRLSIQDLSPLGHQPMHSENGRVSIVFNGEKSSSRPTSNGESIWWTISMECLLLLFMTERQTRYSLSETELVRNHSFTGLTARISYLDQSLSQSCSALDLSLR